MEWTGILKFQELSEKKTPLLLSLPGIRPINATLIFFLSSVEFMEIEKLSISVSRLSQGWHFKSSAKNLITIIISRILKKIIGDNGKVNVRWRYGKSEAISLHGQFSRPHTGKIKVQKKSLMRQLHELTYCPLFK